MSKSGGTVPDGGWGWVIVFVSFFFHLLAGFVSACMSVLYLALQEHFHEGKGFTSWIVSMYNFVMLLMGPVAASLGVKFGFKAVTFVGGILFGLGIFICYFATSVTFIIISLGVISGVGTGLIYVSVLTTSALYFDKKRSLAVGIGTSGVGIGSFLLPPLVVLLEEEYTWRGVLLILSGCAFNMCVCALLLRPLNPGKSDEDCENYAKSEVKEFKHSTTNGKAEKQILMTDGDFVEVTLAEISVGNELEMSDDDTLVQVQQHGQGDTNGLEDQTRVSKSVSGSLHSQVQIDNEQIKTAPSIDTPLNMGMEIMKRNTEKYRLVNNCNEKTRSHSFNEQKTPTPGLSTKHDRQQQNNHFSSLQHLTKFRPRSPELSEGKHDRQLADRRFSSLQHLSKSQQSNVNSVAENRSHGENKSLSHLSLMLMGSIYNIVAVERTLSSMLMSNSKTSIIDNESHKEKFRSETSISFVLKEDVDESSFSAFCNVLKVYVKLVKNWKCLILLAVNFLVNLTYLTPVVYLVDRAVVENGIEKESAILALSLYGAGNTVGRLFTGFLGNLPFMNTMVLYFICIFSCGLVTSLSVFCGPHLYLHVAFGLSFGLFIGGYVILTPVVLVDTLGVEVVAESMGLGLCSMAFSTVIGTPMAGWVYDFNGSYKVPFIFYGAFLILSSFLLIPLIYTSVKEHRDCPHVAREETVPLGCSSSKLQD